MSPYHHLKAITEQFPDTWKLIDGFRMEQSTISDWPTWCLLPKSGWQAIVAKEYNVARLSPKQIKEASYLAAIAAWRYEQGIYRFQRDAYKKLMLNSLKTKLDVRVFYRLPEWSIYVKTPHLSWNSVALAGFWCHLEWDVEKKVPTLQLILNTFTLREISLPLNAQVLNNIYQPQNGSRSSVKDINYHSTLLTMVSLVYYICKCSGSIGTKGKHPEKTQPRLFKGMFKLFPAVQPTLWHIDSAALM
jgi:hypothetical protein